MVQECVIDWLLIIDQGDRHSQGTDAIRTRSSLLWEKERWREEDLHVKAHLMSDIIPAQLRLIAVNPLDLSSFGETRPPHPPFHLPQDKKKQQPVILLNLSNFNTKEWC